MKKAFQAFFSQQSTIAGIAVALMFQLIFSIVWMTGYKGVSDNTSRLTIAMVNEDAGMGAKVAENLKANLPFRLVMVNTQEEAKEMLNRRDAQMMLVIAADFSKKLQTPGEKAQIFYTLNESNAQMIKSIMQGVAGNITATVNKEAIAAGAQAVLAQTGAPAQQAQGMALGLSEKVTSDIQSIHKVSGTANQMVPMMLVLASFVGSMIMSMNLQQTSNNIGNAVGRWRKFTVRAVINVLAAVAVAGIGTALVLMLGGQAEQGFMAMWGFQSLFLMTFLFFAQFFVILFDMGGMVFNIIGLSVQLVTSGAMVPRELLSGFYHQLSLYLPATYAVEGAMNLLFGGPGVSGDVWALLFIMLICAAAGIAAAAVRKNNKTAQDNVSVQPGTLAS